MSSASSENSAVSIGPLAQARNTMLRAQNTLKGLGIPCRGSECLAVGSDYVAEAWNILQRLGMPRCGLGLCRRGLAYVAEARNTAPTLGKSCRSSPNLAMAFVMLFISPILETLTVLGHAAGNDDVDLWDTGSAVVYTLGMCSVTQSVMQQSRPLLKTFRACMRPVVLLRGPGAVQIAMVVLCFI